MHAQVAPNGHASSTLSGKMDELISRVHNGRSDDAYLFGMFAVLAREAGREDLYVELTARATGVAAVASPPGATFRPSAKSEHHHKEGCRLVREGKLDEAEKAFREAIRLEPGHHEAHGNLGVALGQLRRLPEAEAAFRLAIRLSPSVVTMYVNLATCLLQQNRFHEVEEWARQAIQLDSNVAEAHRLLGSSLEARNRLDVAETSFAEAVRLDPRSADAQFGYGTVLSRREKPEEAEKALREAVRLKPSLTGAWASLAGLLGNQDRHTEAADCAREAVKLDPQSADLHNCLGVALAACENYVDAETSYREALRLNSKIPSVHSNLGNALRSLGRLFEAETSLKEALKLKADYPEAHNNLGIVYVQMGRDDDAMKCYDEAIRLAPDYPEARMNRSFAYLGNGDFVRGWPEYEWRWKVKPFKNGKEPGTRWDGSDINGKSLLITAEQGLGDSINFIRYATLAKARGAKIIFDCPVPLSALIETCPGVDVVVPRGQPGPPFDYYAPLLSLPGIFGDEVETAPIPYFRPDPERVAYWREELAGISGLKVGVTWQGSKAHKGDKLRSVSLTRFAPLAAIPGVSLCSLQKPPGTEQLTEGPGAAMGVIDLGSKIGEQMADAAALLMNLDLVVSVDTAIVHLAGALGRPVWVAVPFAADWRWLRDREDTRWYPTMRLFRQPAPGEWDPVFARMAVALAAVSKVRAEEKE